MPKVSVLQEIGWGLNGITKLVWGGGGVHIAWRNLNSENFILEVMGYLDLL